MRRLSTRLHPAAPARTRRRRAPGRRRAGASRERGGPASRDGGAAPAGGIEPPTTRLTGGRSTIELHRNMEAQRASIYIILDCHRSGAPTPALLRWRGQVDPRGIEPPAVRLRGGCSIHLSYGSARRAHLRMACCVSKPMHVGHSAKPSPGAVNAPRLSLSNRMLPTHSLARPLSPGATPPPQRATRPRAAQDNSLPRLVGSRQSTAGRQPTADLQPTNRPTAHSRSTAHERADSRDELTAHKPPERRRPPGFPEAAFANVVDRRVLSCL